LAQTLSLLGLELPGSIQSGTPDNPKGHFESFDIAQYHDRLLIEMGLSWDTFISPPENWFSSEHAEQAIINLCDKIGVEYPGSGPIVLKDPRLSLFMPLWEKVVAKLGLQHFYVIPLRHPFEIAASLDKRNKISKSRALLICLDYLFDAERYSRNCKRSFVTFPQWTQNIEQVIGKIERYLGTGLPEKNKRNMVKVKKEFEQDLVHHKESQTALANNELERLAIDTFDSFGRLTIDPLDASALSEIDEYRDKFNDLSAPFAEIVIEYELKNQTKLEQQVSESEGRAEELEQQLQVSRSEVERSAARADALQQQVSESERRAEELEQQLQVSRSEVEQSAARSDALQQELLTEVASKLELQKEINALEAQNRALLKEYEQLLLEHNNQKLTVIRPLYRNIYRTMGLVLRETLPTTLVESLKNVIPNPDGVPKRLIYKPQLSEQVIAPSELFATVNSDSNPDIFVLSIINWDFRYQRPQHIAKGLADSGRRVFYVEMELAEGKLKLTKASDNLYRARLSAQSLGHIQPYTGQPDQEQTEQWIAAFYHLCDTVSSTAFKQVIIQHPFWWQLARHLPPEFQTIFDCMDDISGFSNTKQFLLDLEHDLFTKCDKLVVSSQHLFNKYKHYQIPVLIRNAAELTHFSKSSKEITRPAFLEQSLIKGPSETIKVGYVGAIAEWFDTELVEEVARNEAGFEFHLCGAVTASEPARLDKVGNIHLHGEIPYTDVPGFLHEMDVLIIPFKIIPIIQACDPVKFYEYSAMGKPTVTTALPELSRASDLAFFATTPLEFAEQIRNAYQKSKARTFRKQLQRYAADNTWQHRTEQLENLLEEMPKVSVVILSYGDPALTKATLHSLYERGRSYPNLEVIIVDNGSPADAVNDIRKFAENYPDVSVIENGENMGFAKGNNVGLEAATGKYVMLLNNDTVVAPGATYAMVRHLANNPAIGAVGPLTNNIGNQAKLFVEYEDMEQMRSVARSATTGYRGIYTPIPVVAYFAVMFRHKDLKTFGLLSEEYGRGMFEDDDHCATIKSKGYLCALAEDAYIHHHLSATFSTLKDGEKEELFETNKKKFEERWGSWQPHKYREERPTPSFINRG